MQGRSLLFGLQKSCHHLMYVCLFVLMDTFLNEGKWVSLISGAGNDGNAPYRSIQVTEQTYLPLMHRNGLLDSYFFQATSISYSGFPWVSGSPVASTELDFRGSGCDHKVLGVLESKNLKTRPNLIKKSQFSNKIWLLTPPKPQGCTQKP